MNTRIVPLFWASKMGREMMEVLPTQHVIDEFRPNGYPTLENADSGIINCGLSRLSFIPRVMAHFLSRTWSRDHSLFLGKIWASVS